ncbi:integrating conjugative element membrane protein [Pseudomonas sp. Ost2]|uniref:TIGR03745 family integrating conjugative element membrane protein n=1 Tax=Pseudomonas sp. Ost2 TaxID=2678260 RepID=UPI001BB3F894|nr:TIGR03745 family integrating conjugative element membrane protein [Pseudomonas sp. Ost2]BBP76720.1 integrating conjugative element membrane protein [Pseudomonas sp. Ost2]
MNILSLFKQLVRPLSRVAPAAGAWSATPVSAALPEMEAPSRGEGNGIIQTLQNHGYDIVALIALAIAAAAFCGVAYHAYCCYSEVQNGKKTWGQFGLTCGVGALLLVIIIWLLTKGTEVL